LRRCNGARARAFVAIPKQAKPKKANSNKAEPEGTFKVYPMERLKRRTDFRALAQAGARAPAKAFVLQALRREDAAQDANLDSGPVRVGFTVSKQVGNAVKRNRVRRRLREMVRLKPETAFAPGHDYALIGRQAALALPFGDMVRELDGALRRIAAGAGNKPPLNRAGSRTGSPARSFTERARGDKRHGTAKTPKER
jgi:ribonuclease P protein component